MQMSDKMRARVENWEGLLLHAYQDSVGVWTIGFGHTGKDVHPGQTITGAQANSLLLADLHTFEIAVAGMAKTSQQQFDAMVSFAFNLGSEALRGSTLLKLHNAGNFEAAAKEFVKWDHAGGRELAGLLHRRQGEAAVYLNGDYTKGML